MNHTTYLSRSDRERAQRHTKNYKSKSERFCSMLSSESDDLMKRDPGIPERTRIKDGEHMKRHEIDECAEHFHRYSTFNFPGKGLKLLREIINSRILVNGIYEKAPLDEAGQRSNKAHRNFWTFLQGVEERLHKPQNL